MARSKYVYLVFHRWREEPLAAFTVKRESQEWAENSVHEMEDLYRVRMKDNPDTRNIDDGADCEWDARARSEHNTPPAFEKEGEGRGIRRIREEVKSEEEVKEVEEVEEVDPLLRDSPFKTSKDVQDFLFQLARAAVKGRDDWRVDRIEKEYGSSYYCVVFWSDDDDNQARFSVRHTDIEELLYSNCGEKIFEDMKRRFEG